MPFGRPPPSNPTYNPWQGLLDVPGRFVEGLGNFADMYADDIVTMQTGRDPEGSRVMSLLPFGRTDEGGGTGLLGSWAAGKLGVEHNPDARYGFTTPRVTPLLDAEAPVLGGAGAVLGAGPNLSRLGKYVESDQLSFPHPSFEQGVPFGSLLDNPGTAPLYSTLWEAVNNLNVGKKGQSGAQIRAALAKTPGVKPNELRESGLDDLLSEAGGGLKFTKQGLLDFMRDAAPYRLQEQWLTGPPAGLGVDNYMSPQYGGQKMPGGANYRELLIKDPEGAYVAPHFKAQGSKGLMAHARMTDRGLGDPFQEAPHDTLFIEELQSDWHQAGGEYGYSPAVDPEVVKALEDRLKREEQDWTNATMDANAAVHDLWDSLDPRTRGILEARSVGFLPASERRAAIMHAIKPNQWGNMIDVGEGEVGDALRALQAKAQEMGTVEAAAAPEAIRRQQVETQAMLDRYQRGRGRSTVPDAPLKKEYRTAMMKRLLYQAVQEGKDSISWTPGHWQQEINDLSRYVDELVWTEDGMLLDGTGTELASDVHEYKDLVDHVGEHHAHELAANRAPDRPDDWTLDEMDSQFRDEYEIIDNGEDGAVVTRGWDADVNFDTVEEAEEYIDDEVRSAVNNWEADWTPDYDDYTVLVEANVGGEGMRKLYDEVITNEFKKVARQLDKNARLEWAEVTPDAVTGDAPEFEVPFIRITPAMRENLLREGTPLYSAPPPATGGGLLGPAPAEPEQLNEGQLERLRLQGLLA